MQPSTENRISGVNIRSYAGNGEYEKLLAALENGESP